MQPRHCLVVLAALGVTTTALAAEPTPKERSEQLNRLIRLLASDSYDDRETASKELEHLGAPALDSLKKACDCDDAEVRHRAEHVRHSIEQRLETERLLKPRRVRLAYKETPLPEAVADLAKKSGVPITLDGDKDALAKRKISIDTNEISFWEALAQFCDRAGLSERRHSTQRADAGMTERQILMQQQIMLLKVQRGAYRNGRAATPAGITLVAGKSEPTPTCVAGALRIRALTGETRTMVHPTNERDAIFSLEVSAEPGMDLLRVMAPRITRAEDDQGTALRIVAPTDEAAAGNMYEELVLQDLGGAAMSTGTSFCTTARARLRDHSTAKSASLCGALLVEVRTPPGPLATVEDVNNAAGKTIPSADGGIVKVQEVKQEGDQLRVRLGVDVPGMNNGARAAMVFRARRAAQAQEVDTDDSVGLALFDASGKRIPGKLVLDPAAGMAWNAASHDYTLNYKLEKGQQASRLVLTGRRNAFLDVPFALKEVPLPGK